MSRTGTESTKLIILSGNSASGKSTTAAEIRARHGERNLAIVGQDNLRRDILRECDVPGGIERVIPAGSSLQDTVRANHA